MKKNTLIEILKKNAGYSIKNTDIDSLLEKITGLNKNQLFLRDHIDDIYRQDFEIIFSRLKNGEPMEYILNNAEFYSLNFYVDNRVLIPRNDTEIMVDKALRCIDTPLTLIDVGTGSSCIPISLLKNSQFIEKCYVVDLSQEALEVSKINIKNYQLENKIQQICGDLLQAFLEGKKLDLLKNVIITANLPYIKQNDYRNMDQEVITHEPAIALYGGEKTGFELYEKLINQCFDFKSIYKLKKLIMYIEIGFDQKNHCQDFLKKKKLPFEIFKDNGGIDRCVKVEFQ